MNSFLRDRLNMEFWIHFVVDGVQSSSFSTVKIALTSIHRLCILGFLYFECSHWNGFI